MGPVRQNQASGSAVHDRAKLYQDLQARNARRARLLEARNRARTERMVQIAREQRPREDS
jgi:hypothetical protein